MVKVLEVKALLAFEDDEPIEPDHIKDDLHEAGLFFIRFTHLFSLEASIQLAKAKIEEQEKKLQQHISFGPHEAHPR